ncbi:hypothetical protein Tco_0450408 [Tanacetum coccineum]
MRQTLADRLRMVYTGDKRHELFTSHAWRRLFEIRGPLVREFILEFFNTCRMSDTEMGLDVADTLCFQLGGARQDGFEAYWHAEGRKSRARMSVGHFIGRLADHFGLVSDEGLIGLSVITRVLLVIDLHQLCKFNICVRLGDTWAWVALGPERQQVAAAGALEVAEGAPVVDEGVPAPVQAPQPPPALARTIAQRLSVLEEEVHNLRSDVGEQNGVLDSMDHDFSRFTTWMVTSLSRMMDQSGVRYTSYFDFQIPYQRRTRRKIGDASSLAAPYNQAWQKSFDEGITMAEPNLNDYISVTRKNFLSDDNEGRMVEKSILDIQGTFLVKIRDNTFNGTIRENAVEHVEIFLEVVRPLKIKGVSHDRFRLSVFPISLAGAASEWFKKDCIGLVTTWEDLEEKSVQKFYHLSYNNDEIEADEDDNPEDIAEIFKIESNLFDFETPLCKAFNEFNYLLKIDTDMFTFDI